MRTIPGILCACTPIHALTGSLVVLVIGPPNKAVNLVYPRSLDRQQVLRQPIGNREFELATYIVYERENVLNSV
jgi:hypothetical protein